MKIAVISDIHANNYALQAILDDIRDIDADSIICLGDIATLGPHPREVIEAVKNLDCTCIKGNHEAALLNPDNYGTYHIPSQLFPCLEWAANRLYKNDYDFFESFKDTYVKKAGTKKCLFFHGSPLSNTDLIISTTADEKIDQLFKNFEFDIYIGGHSHLPMLRRYKNSFIVNPGSVGLAFMENPKDGAQPEIINYAAYAIIHVIKNNLNVELKQVQFDFRAYIQDMESSDFPLKNWLISQYKRYV